MNLLDDIVAQAQQLTAIRRDIHANPELCFHEHRTAQVVKDKLTEWGIPFEEGIGGTGVVGILKNGSSYRAIGLRADMDALPIDEANCFEHRSTHAGRMHACGHDGHTTMLLGAAKYLAETKRFNGVVNFIFQPAEEGIGGARAMIADGLFDKFPCEAIFGMHNWPGLKLGQIAMCSGPMMASSNEFRITLRGRGTHAALPHNGIDPVPVACQMVQAFQTIITRNRRPVDPGVISVTMIHTGEATNVVPDQAELQGTVRTFTVGFPDARYDERPYARAVAERASVVIRDISPSTLPGPSRASERSPPGPRLTMSISPRTTM